MTNLLRQGKPVRSREVWLRRAEDENVVVDRSTGAVNVLNSPAFALWVLCDGENEPLETIDAVCEISGLPKEVVEEEEVARTFDDLGAGGLIRWA